LHLKFNETLQTLKNDPIVKTFNEKGSVYTTIRRRAINPDSGIDLFILERTDFGVTPEQFMQVMIHIYNFTKVNKNMKKCELIEEIDLCDKDPTVQIYSSFIKPRSAFIAGRIFVDAKYIWSNENLCIMSSEGNQQEREQYFQENANEIKGMSDAFCYISGFKFTPVFDDKQTTKVIGTSVVF
jgi:hypothetical protein